MFIFCPYCGYKILNQQHSGFQCPSCKKWTHYASAPAVSIAVKCGNEGLIAIRGIDPGKGEMDLVGGFLEYGEDPLDGAIREFKEEAGSDISEDQLKLLGIWIGSYKYQGENQLVLNIVYLLEVDKKIKIIPADDVADLIWVPFSTKPKFAFAYLDKVWEKIKK